MMTSVQGMIEDPVPERTGNGFQQTGIQTDTLVVGGLAPPFTMRKIDTLDELVYLSDYTGRQRRVAQIRGTRRQIVVLSFFSSTCIPCEKEMPVLTEIAQEYRNQDVLVFFICLNEPDSIASDWLSKHPDIRGTVLMDEHGTWGKRYGVDTLPRTIIIDKERIVRLIIRGFESEDYHTLITGTLDSIIDRPERYLEDSSIPHYLMSVSFLDCLWGPAWIR